jgi:hypothetical protein
MGSYHFLMIQLKIRKLSKISLFPLGRAASLLVDVKEKETFARDFRPRDWRAEDSALLLEEREIHTDRRLAIARKP